MPLPDADNPAISDSVLFNDLAIVPARLLQPRQDVVTAGVRFGRPAAQGCLLLHTGRRIRFRVVVALKSREQRLPDHLADGRRLALCSMFDLRLQLRRHPDWENSGLGPEP